MICQISVRIKVLTTISIKDIKQDHLQILLLLQWHDLYYQMIDSCLHKNLPLFVPI